MKVREREQRIGTLSAAHRNHITELLKRVYADIGLEQMAAQTGVSQAGLRKYRYEGWVPAERVLQLEHASEGLLSRYVLRPDLYPPNETPPPVPPEAVRLVRIAFLDDAA